MVVAIFGATASGKSALALALASRTTAEIVSVDSMQVYAGVETLTNQPSAFDRAQVAHHLVGYLPMTAASSVGAHTPRAHAAIDQIAERGATPLVVGGTGLYLRAALTDLALPPAVPAAERARWEAFYDERGGPAALAELASLDPRAAERLHANDRRRVVRGLELAERGASLAPDQDRLWGAGMRRPAVVAVVSWPRTELRARRQTVATPCRRRRWRSRESGATRTTRYADSSRSTLSPTRSKVQTSTSAMRRGQRRTASARCRPRCSGGA